MKIAEVKMGTPAGGRKRVLAYDSTHPQHLRALTVVATSADEIGNYYVTGGTRLAGTCYRPE